MSLCAHVCVIYHHASSIYTVYATNQSNTHVSTYISAHKMDAESEEAKRLAHEEREKIAMERLGDDRRIVIEKLDELMEQLVAPLQNVVVLEEIEKLLN